MHFSGKITNSVLNHLARLGWDRERLFELTDVPLEYLRDPTSWIDAGSVESFLRAVEAEFTPSSPQLLHDIGHASAELRGWGVLDSVLRMMQNPQDIYSQPQRFISYFVSPAPPIVNLRKSEEAVSFDLPIADSEYPATVAYLCSALEGLPRYWGQEPAQVSWRGLTVKIGWSTAQNRLLDEGVTNPRPELVESLVHGVEMAQAQVETRDLEIARLEQELRELRSKANKPSASPSTAFSEWDGNLGERQQLREKLFEVRENVLRLTDYLTRSQQALTMARTAHRQDPQVQAVLKRIDWDTIRSQYPWIHLQIMEGLDTADSLLDPKPATPNFARAGRVRVGDILNGVIERLQAGQEKPLNMRAQSFVPQAVYLDVDRLHVALLQLLSAATRLLGPRGDVELLARLDGATLEISIEVKGDRDSRRQDELPLLRGEKQMSDAALASAVEVIQQQNGQLLVGSETGGQRRMICRWPLARLEENTHESNSKHPSP